MNQALTVPAGTGGIIRFAKGAMQIGGVQKPDIQPGKLRFVCQKTRATIVRYGNFPQPRTQNAKTAPHLCPQGMQAWQRDFIFTKF
ncbi:hypothetical protein [Marimonas lutisalis]|uniref:hypothetical protein n=1 Tax=Marimonas lutisalis TaxID=2545756 RepID=UPI001476C742|nr:hypothetical protein [Marimonas lutisalis]